MGEGSTSPNLRKACKTRWIRCFRDPNFRINPSKTRRQWLGRDPPTEKAARVEIYGREVVGP